MSEVISNLVVIKPITITDAMLTSHSVAESEATYDAGTTYAEDEVVKYGSDHDAFSSKVGSNTGNTPVKWPDETSYWYDEGKTNRWNMFDLTTNIQTIGTSPMTVVLEPGCPITAIHFDSLECDTIDISISDGSSEVYTASLDAKTRDVLDWYSFFYEEYRYKRILAVYDVPGGVSNPEITITFTNSSGDAKCGGLIIGKHYHIGTTQGSSSSVRRGFSEFQRDEIDSSRVRLLQRRSVRSLSVKALVMQRSIDRVQNLLDDLDGTVASWSGIDSNTDEWFSSFIVRGVYKSPVDITKAEDTDEAYFNFDIEGI